MNILLNGKDIEVDEGILLIDLIVSLNLKSNVTVVEINSTIINSNAYNRTKIKPDDKIEMIRFMGGGED